MVTRRAVLSGVGGAVLLGGLAIPHAASGQAARTRQAEHPFLLVTADEYDEVRARANAEPWATWKATAAEKAAEPYDTGEPLGTRVRQLAQLAGASSLTYVLDPEQSDAHAARVLELIDAFDSDIYPELDSGSWNACAGASSPYFHLVLGLDLIYNDIDADQRADAEAKLAKAADWYYANREGSWTTARIGGYGIWAVYTGDSARIDESMAALEAEFEAESSADGVLLIGTNYGSHRYGSSGDRDTKSYYVDVLTKTGHHDFYADRAYIDRMEFFTGYIVTPVTRRRDDGGVERDEFTFGDSPTTRGTVWKSARTYSASRFGAVAARNAGWSLNRVTNEHVPGMLTFYVLAEQAPATDAMAPSRIFDAGAWFYEQNTSEQPLAGALWNATKEAQHQHADTNALHLTAYGEHVLRNSGYNGWGAGIDGFTWEAIHDRAVVNNTLLLDYGPDFDDSDPPATNDHQRKYGAGIVEGCSGGLFEYASGDSGNALPNGTHVRNFCFVHPQGGAGGYWVLFDDVQADGTWPARMPLHPNSDTDPDVVTEDEEYSYAVGGPYPRTSNNVRLSIYLATPPTDVGFRSGPFADRGESYAGRYLFPRFATDDDGEAHIVTVLFPYDDNHPKAELTRASGDGYSGARIVHPDGPTDYALEATGGSTIPGEAGASFRAPATVYRVNAAGNLASYFVRRGRNFSHGANGFEATATVSVYVRNNAGNILNRNADPVDVTFSRPGITGVTLDGDPADVLDSGDGWVQVAVPPGTFQLALT